ncbi:MAG: hypothetical protein ACP5JP_07940 [bacterium]
MKIAILIKEGNPPRLTDGIRLVLGLTINHRVSLLITESGAKAIAEAIKDESFKNKFLESMELISKMSGIIRTEKAIEGAEAIDVISQEALLKLLLSSDSIIVF